MDKFINRLKVDFSRWGKVLNIDDFKLEIIDNLNNHNFKKENSRLVFCVCPDDINRLQERETIENILKQYFNGEFHLGNLAAYPVGGISGMIAASHHAPNEGNLIFFVSPHLGLSFDEKASYGKILRPGQKYFTSACGAMMGFLNRLKGYKNIDDLKENVIDYSVDPTMSILYNEFLTNHFKQLMDILEVKGMNQQIVLLLKLNYEIVMKKLKQMLSKLSDHYDGKYSIIGGLTVNTVKKDYFILKECSFS